MRLLAAIALCIIPAAVFAANPDTDSAEQCRAMSRVQAPQTTLTAAQLVTDRQDISPFCQLEGEIAGRVGFVMRLPAANCSISRAV